MTKLNFIPFREAVAAQFKRMSAGELYVVDIGGRDVLTQAYLDAFPEGTDPLYKVRSEHDCNCCKQFIRHVGNVVAIIDGKIESIWDIKPKGVDDAYVQVAKSLSDKVRSMTISGIFRTTERKAGNDFTFEKTGEKHNHFFVNIPSRFISQSVGTVRGQFDATVQVFSRSLNEITIDATETILELIAANSIYRGQDHKFALDGFLKLQKEYSKLGDSTAKSLFILNKISSGSTQDSILRIRNTAIGTFLIDLSSGVDLETAVKKFESVMAPANYKRPTALVTEKMVKDARAKLEELGLTSALHRRHANLNDLDINDILFADRGITPSALLTDIDDVFGDVAKKETLNAKKFDKSENITLEKFINDVIPTSKKVEILFENSLASKMVSLVTAQDPTANKLFKWDNHFTWSYIGDFTDSIKERVKAAGGAITGDLMCRLSWDNETDLDFHMTEPTAHEINYGMRGVKSSCGGMLDVDANGLSGMRSDPVENIVYKSLSTMKKGKYDLFVNPWSVRSRNNEGFTVQIELLGEVYEYTTDKFPKSKLKVAELKSDGYGNVKIEYWIGGESKSAKREVWGLSTGEFQRVNVIMNSPNAFGNTVIGNKHVFFMLDKCVNPESARGFYNEYLSPEVDKHRKVLEIVGGKMRTGETDNQLSGIGFSVTAKTDFIVRVTGKTVRTFKVSV